MRFASLGSGSEGNGLVVQAGSTTLLLDCGFSVADTVRRLARLFLTPEDISGVVVTHEHDDHVGGVPRFARKYDIPVYLSHGTLMGTGVAQFEGVVVNIIDSHCALAVGDIELRPFPVPHDAREPTQFVFGDGNGSLGVLTDSGVSTAHIESMLCSATALVLECNHDLATLMGGPYPPALKKRIAGRLGHLDNATAAAIIRALPQGKLRHVVAAHLSQQNNTPALARRALADALGCEEAWVGVATQEAGFAWRDL